MFRNLLHLYNGSLRGSQWSSRFDWTGLVGPCEPLDGFYGNGNASLGVITAENSLISWFREVSWAEWRYAHSDQRRGLSLTARILLSHEHCGMAMIWFELLAPGGATSGSHRSHLHSNPQTLDVCIQRPSLVLEALAVLGHGYNFSSLTHESVDLF
jgi:hypothetical protein